MQPASFQALSGYRAYLVRLWQDSPYAEWRAAVQSVQTGETIRFADLEQLFTFLRTQSTTQHPNDEPLPRREERSRPPT